MVWFAAPLNGLPHGTLGSLVLLRAPVCFLWPQLKCVLCKPAVPYFLISIKLLFYFAHNMLYNS